MKPSDRDTSSKSKGGSIAGSTTGSTTGQTSRRKGRPPTLDLAKREVIIALVSVGCTRTYAARYLGISPQTVLNTAARNEEFALRIEQAAANLQVDHLQTVAVASRRTWQASAWVLERIAPERFSNPQIRKARRQFLKRFKKLVFGILSEQIVDDDLKDRLEQQVHKAYLEMT